MVQPTENRPRFDVVRVGLMLAEKMQSMFFTATTVACSLVCSVLLNHFGWVGSEVHPVNLWRLVGCALLLAGLFLVSKL
jgi:bacterial/archaeal transporter family-2 protein